MGLIAPVIRLAHLWQDFQQVGISVERLGDVLNTPVKKKSAKCATRNSGISNLKMLGFGILLTAMLF
ncbi:hypothetical protein ACLB1E_37435 [Escherichia coli]